MPNSSTTIGLWRIPVTLSLSHTHTHTDHEDAVTTRDCLFSFGDAGWSWTRRHDGIVGVVVVIDETVTLDVRTTPGYYHLLYVRHGRDIDHYSLVSA